MRNEYAPYLKSARLRSPASRPRPTPQRRLPPEVLTDAEVRSLMAACAGPPLTAARNRALVALLYRTGLRIGEDRSWRNPAKRLRSAWEADLAASTAERVGLPDPSPAAFRGSSGAAAL